MVSFKKFNFDIYIMFMLFFASNVYSTTSFLKKTFTLSELSLLEKEIHTTKVIEAFCFLNSNGTVYDLNPLYNATTDYTRKDKNSTMYFNFCKQAHTQCKSKNTTSLAILIDEKDNCYSLGGSKSSLSKWNILSKKNK